jgi:hypothetical protein
MEVAECQVHLEDMAAGRLTALGLSESLLVSVLLQADAEAAQVTALDPPTAEGMARYAATVRFLRMALLPLGWDYDNTGNFCRTLAPSATHAIVTSSGDTETAHPLGNPSTKYVKGEATTQAVVNNQLMLDLGAEFGVGPAAGGETVPTWFLLQRVESNAIHAELSLPRRASAGRITEWEERIVLGPIDRTSPERAMMATDENEGDAYDVGVARR